VVNNRFYIDPLSENHYAEQGFNSIMTFLQRIKFKKHILNYFTPNEYVFRVIDDKKLVKNVDYISFADREKLIKVFDTVEDFGLIQETFPIYYRVTLNKSLSIDKINEEFNRIVDLILYAQKNKEGLVEDKKSVLSKSGIDYLSYIGYSIIGIVMNAEQLNRNKRKELLTELEILKDNLNYDIFAKIDFRDTNIKQYIDKNFQHILSMVSNEQDMVEEHLDNKQIIQNKQGDKQWKLNR